MNQHDRNIYNRDAPTVFISAFIGVVIMIVMWNTVFYYVGCFFICITIFGEILTLYDSIKSDWQVEKENEKNSTKSN